MTFAEALKPKPTVATPFLDALTDGQKVALNWFAAQIGVLHITHAYVTKLDPKTFAYQDDDGENAEMLYLYQNTNDTERPLYTLIASTSQSNVDRDFEGEIEPWADVCLKEYGGIDGVGGDRLVVLDQVGYNHFDTDDE